MEGAASNDLVIITVRVIKNFEYRTIKNIILKVDLNTETVREFRNRIQKEIEQNPAFVPFRNVEYDSLKVYSHAFGNKTQNLVVNMERDGFLDDPEATLAQCGLMSESEVSYFNLDAYNKYVINPVNKW
ncbi:hypothetical protein AYI68_g6631 [Smittium mucronatum]|uniref:Uncharacterized protein n=1 Tax=Smittium mucronatum TaxID=133383 RepID=A0A1R0GQZ3_9FUNG|nr:hypothetical protein AYI68_g6631 [Smittium mucronatum]